MNDEEAKAAQEVAKAVPRVFDSVDALGRFVEEAFGYPVREAGGFLGDWIKFKRDNWRVTCEKAQEALDRRGVERIEAIPAKYGVSIIEKACLEDDGLIQSMWANLIANSLDPSSSAKPSKIFISILGELEPLDAHILDRFHTPFGVIQYVSVVADTFQIPFEEVSIAVYNLKRLGLVMMPNAGTDQSFNIFSIFSFTPLCGAILKHIKLPAGNDIET